MAVLRSSVSLYLLLLAYLLLALSLLLPEAHWQLQGTAFTTRLAGQWSGYVIVALMVPAAGVHMMVYRRRRYIALGPSLLAGAYVLGFAVVKWVRLRQLSADFQQVETTTSASVVVGSGLYLMAASGFLLLLLGLWGWFGRLKRGPSSF